MTALTLTKMPPFEYCKLFCRVQSELKPPFFIGSQLRGAFGWALKELSTSLFDEFFGTQNAYHRYRFDFVLGQNAYEFSLYLFGKAAQNAQLALLALCKMLAQNGLQIHSQSVKFKNFSLFINEQLCCEFNAHKSGLNGTDFGKIQSELTLPANFTKSVNLADFEAEFNAKFKQNANDNFACGKINKNADSNPASMAILRLLTPLRIKKNNVFVRDENLALNDILKSIFQRQNALFELDCQKNPAFKGQISSANLHFVELVRKSSRQGTMNLGGLLGQLHLSELNAQSYALLRLGELIGAGKSCVFGLGKIAVLC